jgi:hypothetical protein
MSRRRVEGLKRKREKIEGNKIGDSISGSTFTLYEAR